MSPFDLGLQVIDVESRFDYLANYCSREVFNTFANNSGKVSVDINKINEDLQKLKANGDEKLTREYKRALLPHLEQLHYSIKHLHT